MSFEVCIAIDRPEFRAVSEREVAQLVSAVSALVSTIHVTLPRFGGKENVTFPRGGSHNLERWGAYRRFSAFQYLLGALGLWAAPVL